MIEDTGVPDPMTSLRRKIAAYCDFHSQYRTAADFPAGLDVAAREGKLTLLRAVSKELDVRIREMMSDEEQSTLLQLMSEYGVAAVDLPKL